MPPGIMSGVGELELLDEDDSALLPDGNGCEFSLLLELLELDDSDINSKFGEV